MYYELRTYTLDPLKLADWLALYQSHALEVQTEHLGKLIGFFTTEFGEANQVVHLWGYTSLDERMERRKAMAADPRWAEFSRRNRELGAVLKLQSRVLRPTGFSPLQ
ncbi:NIPSNAP family protein [Pseudomonas sp. SWI6]|uniref:NIPSNAP family protein n=1 Tax=Pseudomonas TaxID=286 RepID=UPI0003C06774|nr:MULTISPECIES: NIPSNAP family protein [Pseudomonas]AGZ35398.1 NIPSNAP family protein [Pseudomonas sp. VLB120]AVD83141.1 NIPSNAP family protein [Pseudomonas sp. SWI6]MDT8923528.1 NIPSNAP family protein [Pseudomonas taiwanensis]MPT01950.1 NIPSNAP family protein [Pseudomonas sp.]QQZ34092.1 NIPSNAP family protein [Pseudomonas sp. SK2]